MGRRLGAGHAAGQVRLLRLAELLLQGSLLQRLTCGLPRRLRSTPLEGGTVRAQPRHRLLDPALQGGEVLLILSLLLLPGGLLPDQGLLLLPLHL